MSVLSKYFDKGVNQSSPCQKDLQRIVKYDEDGNEIVSWSEVDYPKFQQSLGTAKDWSLDRLVKAGISPDFNIATSFPSRIEGLKYVEGVRAAVDKLFPEEVPVKTEE